VVHDDDDDDDDYIIVCYYYHHHHHHINLLDETQIPTTVNAEIVLNFMMEIQQCS
jgi:hypothetical protein